MSWTQVDFSTVRYSPIEGTHFFYDPRHPSSIQFLLSGRWESWDVGWVKYKAQDPDIRRVAEDAEARLVQDPQSGYVQWPSQPPPGPPPLPVQSNVPPQPYADYTQACAGAEPPQPMPPSPGYAYDVLRPVSPDTLFVDPELSYPPSMGHSNPPVYEAPVPQDSGPSQPRTIPIAPMHATPANRHQINGNTNYQPAQPAPAHLHQPVAPTGVVLSRNRETKILLSLDGNGIRGLSALLVVESLVNAICTKLNQRLDTHQIFDLIGGNSLGGVIAIMLCRLRMQAHRAREAYKQIAKQVFYNKRDHFLSLGPHGSIPLVDATALEEEIKIVLQQEIGSTEELLLDGRDDSGDVFVVSTHIEIGTNKAALMRSYQTRRITGPELDANMTILQAMKATCVAPRYMLPEPGVNQRLVIEPGLVDHGTAKNNPIRDILYECRKLFRYANDMMIIVSVGCGEGLDRTAELPEMANSVEDRNAEARIWGEKFEADHQALMERGWMKYFRFNVTGLEDVPLEEWCHEELIKQKTSAYLAQPEVGQRFYACVDAITSLLVGPVGWV